MVRRILGAGALVASLLTVATPPASAWTRSPWRIAGSDRYQTSVDLSHAAYANGAPTAVLVSGTAFPDGLAAGPLAALDKGPVLLTQPDALPMNVAVELQRLGVTSVTVVGGTAAVQDHVLDQITQVTGATTTRLAGIDRYDTAAKVADQFPAAAAAAYVADGITFTPFIDGNRNGVLTRDIRDGIDRALGPPVRLGDLYARTAIVLAVPATGDAVQLSGGSNLLSLTPVGTATAGSIYIRGGNGPQFAIRVLGPTARTRIQQYDERRRVWVDTR